MPRRRSLWSQPPRHLNGGDGASADNTGFLLDGMNNTQRRNTGAMINATIEGVQEFRMPTSGCPAEHGRAAGGMLTVASPGKEAGSASAVWLR